jgi:flavin-dependent dehydrogenase
MTAVDLVIVGAGPAGLGTALHLVQTDSSWADRLVVVEKASHPRHKVCAGGLTRFALRQLEQLGLRLGVPWVEVDEAHLLRGPSRIVFRGQPLMAVVQRSEFDAWLANQARQHGVRILENHPASRIGHGPNGMDLQAGGQRFQAQVLVGADGAASIVRRWLGDLPGRRCVARALEAVALAGDEDPRFIARRAHFDFTHLEGSLHGYTWEFPSLVAGRPAFHRGVYDARLDRARPRPDLPSLLHQFLDRRWDRSPHPPFKAGGIPSFAPSARLSANRIVLVGDAAGAGPLFGEGIGVALGYAAVAAGSIQRAFATGDLRFRDYRRHVLASPLGPYLMARYLVARLAYCGKGSVVWALWQAARLWSVLADPAPPLRGALPSGTLERPTASS